MPVDGGSRHHHREHRPAAHPVLARLLDREPVVGDQRLHPDVRRAAPSRRPAGRHTRAPQGLRLRRAAVRPGLPAGRPLPGVLATARRACAAGRRWCDRLTDRTLPHHHDLPGRARAQPGVRGVRRRVCGRERDRPARGRRARGVARLALGLLRQRPHRAADRFRDTPVHQGIPTPPRPLRPSGCPHLHTGHGAARLRIHPGVRGRVDRCPDHRCLRGRGGLHGGLPDRGAPVEAAHHAAAHVP
ncbi:hypothetical protein RKD45_006461 [Streptomyces griseus]